MTDLLFLHSSGMGWDEALVVFGGLAVLTAALLMRLRGDEHDSATEPVQQDKKSTKRRTH